MCTTSDPERLEYEAGVKYILKQKQLDYKTKDRDAQLGLRPINSVALYYDLAFFPINVVYFPLKGKLLFSEVDAEGNVQDHLTTEEYENELLTLEDQIKLDEVRAGQVEGEKEKSNGFVSFLDFTLFAVPNILYFPFSDRTVLGTVNNNTIKGYDDIERNRAEGTVKEKRARTYLRKLGVYREPPSPSILEEEGYMKLVALGFPGVVSSSGPLIDWQKIEYTLVRKES